jgi:GT2 family glycosyltransferase
MRTITVVIATFNRPEALRQTLSDLARQTQPPLEIIVVDQSRAADGSPASMGEELRAFHNARYFHQAVPNAQVARNRGIAEARGEILLFIDDDVRMAPEFVAHHCRNYEADSAVDGVSGQTLDVGQAPTGEIPPSFRWPGNGWMFFPLNYDKRQWIINWPSCNASVKRSLALQIGGFDEQFTRTWFDDADFSWRLHLAGARVVFDPEASLVHLKVPSGGNRPAGRDRYVLYDAESWAIIFYFWRKNFGVLRVWRHVRRYIRGHIIRKVLLRRPHLLILACWNLIRGYQLATVKLKTGPIYMRSGQPDADEPAPRPSLAKTP